MAQFPRPRPPRTTTRRSTPTRGRACSSCSSRSFRLHMRMAPPSHRPACRPRCCWRRRRARQKTTCFLGSRSRIPTGHPAPPCRPLPSRTPSGPPPSARPPRASRPRPPPPFRALLAAAASRRPAATRSGRLACTARSPHRGARAGPSPSSARATRRPTEFSEPARPPVPVTARHPDLIISFSRVHNLPRVEIFCSTP